MTLQAALMLATTLTLGAVLFFLAGKWPLLGRDDRGLKLLILGLAAITCGTSIRTLDFMGLHPWAGGAWYTIAYAAEFLSCYVGGLALVGFGMAIWVGKVLRLREATAARQAAEASLERSDSRLRAILSNVLDLVTVVTQEGTIAYQSPSSLPLLGYAPEDLIGRNIGEFIHPEDAPAAFGELARLLARPGEVSVIEIRIRHRDGRWIPIETRTYSPPDRQATGGVVCNSRDVSLHKRLRAELEAARDDAEMGSRAKSTFLAHMSHELRTPLNAVIGFSDLMCNETFGPIDNPRYRNYVTDIRSCSAYLLSLITRILDLSAIEAGQMKVFAESCLPADVVKGAIDVVRPQAERKRQVIDHLSDDPGRRFVTDPLRLQQAIVNLLANAVKFTPEDGRVSVTISATADGGLEIAVRDSGIGMTEAEIVEALQPFRRTENAYVRQQEGSGLGLPLASALVRLLGGKLTIDSQPGQGTTARIELPDRGPDQPLA